MLRMTTAMRSRSGSTRRARDEVTRIERDITQRNHAPQAQRSYHSGTYGKDHAIRLAEKRIERLD